MMSNWLSILPSYALAGLLSLGSLTAAPPDPQVLADRIDAHIDARLKEAGVPAAPPASDAEFLRRAHLDIAGRIPSSRDVYEFLADKSPDKRGRLIDALLETPRYASHGAAVWRATLAPETTSLPDARIFRVGFEEWLRIRLRQNLRYDALVRELLGTEISTDSESPTPVLRRPDDANPLAFFAVKEAKPENMAAAVSRVFLGVQIECAQCHNHPFARWTREQFWNQAAFFAALERNDDSLFAPLIERTGVRDISVGGGKNRVGPVFLDEKAPTRSDTRLRTELADWITRRDNPFFARAAVNRIWGRLFGRGLVEPVDDFHDDNPASHPELLDELAKAFADSGFDLHLVIRSIGRSKAYGRTSARTDAKQDDPRLFARMAVKGLTGEQLYDSLVRAVGYRDEGGRNSPRDQFLTRFAAAGRPAEPETSIPQALALMNGKFIADATALETGPTLTAAHATPGLRTPDRITMLYVAALGREPSRTELDRTLAHIGDATGNRFAERLGDVFWALLNSVEFRLNH